MNAAGLTRLIKAPAIDGMHLPGTHIAALMGSHGKDIDEAPRSHLSLTRPAVGCFLSHLAIWRQLTDKNLPRVLILEDDAAPTAICSLEKLQSALSSIARRRRLGFSRANHHGRGLAVNRLGLARIYYLNGTFPIALRQPRAEGSCDTFSPLLSHIDHQISRLLVEQRHALPAYYNDMNPQLIAPWSLCSDCYVPLTDEGTADHQLGQIIKNNRRLLLEEGCPLLPEPAS